MHPIPRHPHAPARAYRTALTFTVMLLAAAGLTACDTVGKTIDKARMKIMGIEVLDPERETAEWVLRQAIDAANNSNEEEGWERFQKMLHSDERTPNSLRNWYDNGWKRMRRQAKDYLAPDNSFKLADYKEIMSSTGELAGVEFFVVSTKKEMPTPCAVYRDAEQEDRWRIRRCSL